MNIKTEITINIPAKLANALINNQSVAWQKSHESFCDFMQRILSKYDNPKIEFEDDEMDYCVKVNDKISRLCGEHKTLLRSVKSRKKK